jgi:hypothetical protein
MEVDGLAPSRTPDPRARRRCPGRHDPRVGRYAD